MERTRGRAYVGILTLIAATAAGLRWMPEPDPGPALALRLPERLPDGEGATVVFCQNDQCERSFTGLSPAERCPACGAALDEMAAGERALLPPGTRILRRRYAGPGAAPVLVTVVFSQGERRSIHRPQVCLAGQGYAIIDERTLDVPLAGRRPLRVMVLDVRRRGAAEGRGEYQAYWFVNADGRETPRHLVRLYWSAWDAVARNRRPAWAYVTVSWRRAGRGADDLAALRGFLARLYPRLWPAGDEATTP